MPSLRVPSPTGKSRKWIYGLLPVRSSPLQRELRIGMPRHLDSELLVRTDNSPLPGHAILVSLGVNVTTTWSSYCSLNGSLNGFYIPAQWYFG